MSTIKADAVTTKSDNTDLTITGGGTGVPNLEAGFKVGGSAGVPTASIQDDAVTLAKLAAGTDGELITWDASGDPAAVAVGTATHVLTSNGAGAAPTFQAAAGGAWSVITHTVASSASTISFTGFDSSTYGAYQVFWRYTPGTDNSRLYLRTSSNGGSSYDSGATDYRYAMTSVNDTESSGSITKSTGNEYITLQGASGGNASGEHNMGYLFIVNPNAAVNCYINFLTSNQWDDVKWAYTVGGAMRASAADVDAIQLYPNSGTATGEFTFLGMKKA